MQTSVNLHELYSYSTGYLIFTLGVIIAVTLLLVYAKIKGFKLKPLKTEIKNIPERNIRNIPVIKNKYLKHLEEIEKQYDTKIIDLRKAYQMISEDIRMFVFEVTNITTQNYSLLEIKKLSIPYLYELIKEYYEPEFASKPEGDFKSSINKARRIINEWK